jgi:hypothetical protein
MSLKSLEELEAEAKPNAAKHWILPNVVPLATQLLLTGDMQQEIACELAVSASTVTPFLASIQPSIVGRVILVTNDSFHTATYLRKLLAGRDFSESPEDLKILTEGSSWTEIQTAVFRFNPRLIVINSLDDTLPQAQLYLTWAQQLAHKGISTVRTVEISELRVWPDCGILHCRWDKIDETITITTGARGWEAPIARATPCGQPQMVQWQALPLTDLCSTELNVWKVLRQQGPVTQSQLLHALGWTKTKKAVLRDALEALQRSDLASYSIVSRTIANKVTKYKLWAAYLEAK